jgi:hypothetical protein
MSTEENKALARRWAEEIFNQGNLDAADELFGPDFITRYLDAPDLDRESWKEFPRPFISGFSERRLAVEGLVSEGEGAHRRMPASPNRSKRRRPSCAASPLPSRGPRGAM